MLDQLLGTILFFLGLSGSVKGESTSSAMASESAVGAITTTLTNALTSATKSSASVSISDMESYNTLVSQKNTERQKTREKNMETFQKGTSAITNQARKANMMEIQNRLMSIRDSQITVMEHELTALQNAVDKMEENSGTASGSLVTTRIPEAQTAIAKAASALYAFSEKQHVITFTSGEKNIKSDAQKVRKQLETDLKSVVNAISDARKKVKAAYDEYRTVTKKTIKISVFTDVLPAMTATNSGQKK